MSYHLQIALCKNFDVGKFIHTEPPSTLQDTLACPLYSSKSYPNISTILHILSVTPVTLATTERANSALKFVKSDRRSVMGQDRLNSLLLLFVLKDIKLDYDSIVSICMLVVIQEE